MDNLSRKSAWSREQLAEFLEQIRVPMRISVIDDDYPFICSVWFEYADGTLRIVSHKDSKLAKSLVREQRCAFEIAPMSRRIAVFAARQTSSWRRAALSRP